MGLGNLKNATRASKRIKRVGRGPGTGMGKTSGRGQKGAGARSGYNRRVGYEGGGLRFFLKLPTRGFTRGYFRKRIVTFNLGQINEALNEGDVINEENLRKHGLISGKIDGIKILGDGKLTKKFGGCEIKKLSATAKEQLKELVG